MIIIVVVVEVWKMPCLESFATPFQQRDDFAVKETVAERDEDALKSVDDVSRHRVNGILIYYYLTPPPIHQGWQAEERNQDDSRADGWGSGKRLID